MTSTQTTHACLQDRIESHTHTHTHDVPRRLFLSLAIIIGRNPCLISARMIPRLFGLDTSATVLSWQGITATALQAPCQITHDHNTFAHTHTDTPQQRYTVDTSHTPCKPVLGCTAPICHDHRTHACYDVPVLCIPRSSTLGVDLRNLLSKFFLQCRRGDVRVSIHELLEHIE